MRQSKRYSVTALYLSMSAKEKDLEIEDDLARGMRNVPNPPLSSSSLLTFACVSVPFSPEDTP
jgi:hypothetical protein